MPAFLQRCLRCQLNAEGELLREIAYNEERYLPDLLQKARKNLDSAIHLEASKYMERRLNPNVCQRESLAKSLPEVTEEPNDGSFFNLDRHGMDISAGIPRTEAAEITEEDVKNALAEYGNRGELDIQKGKVIVTPRGANFLATRALDKILQKIRCASTGTHPIDREDPGTEPSLITRRYEVGDNYSEVDVEQTILNALKRCGKLRFEPEDFEIRDKFTRTKLCAAIIIDESGSMRDHQKLPAAMETAMALAKLISRDPENILKIFVFANEVKQIQPRDIVNEIISGGDTDIKGALAAFRRTARQDQGDKQAYLITDTEPNNEGGRHIPFNKAVNGLFEEASRYRQEKIGLNIIMLSQAAELKTLASSLAKRNLGRVFFTSPGNLGEILLEDYLLHAVN